jgi:hypothetical protein
MIALEIRLNGELKTTCGAENLRQLGAMMMALRSRKAPDEMRYSVECHGVLPKSKDTEEVLCWLRVRIALGDEISFKFVEATEVQPPIDRQEISVDRSSCR